MARAELPVHIARGFGARVIIASTGHGHVLFGHFGSLPFEEELQRVLQHREVDAQQGHHDAE
jgi:hypothetical protein